MSHAYAKTKIPRVGIEEGNRLSQIPDRPWRRQRCGRPALGRGRARGLPEQGRRRPTPGRSRLAGVLGHPTRGRSRLARGLGHPGRGRGLPVLSTLGAVPGRAGGRRTTTMPTRSPTTWWAAAIPGPGAGCRLTRCCKAGSTWQRPSPCARVWVVHSRAVTFAASATPSGRRPASRTDRCQPQHRRRSPTPTFDGNGCRRGLVDPVLALRRRKR